ncbi:MAG: hypothetical protein V1926_00610 [Candidatus Peregrinibacteria bacterium]
MTQTCRQCSAPFEVTPADLAFLAKISPVFCGKKFTIPPPTLCPDCRQQRRLLWRNERNLYRRTCDLCKKSIISQYSPDKPFTVYCTECWWSDKWDPMSFGRDFDFSKPFFEQFRSLQVKVPRLALNVVGNENAEYVHLSGYNKNCYLLFAAEYNEDCYFGTQVVKSINCMDAFDCFESEYCYEVTDVEKCHTVLFSRSCSTCSDSAFLFDCRGCSECLFSANLRNANQVVCNRQCTPAEYAREKTLLQQRLDRGELPQMQREFQELECGCLHRSQDSVNCESATGDYLKNCRNVRGCFDLSYGEDCAYVFTGYHVRDLMDVCHTTDAEMGYEGISLGYTSYNTICTHGSWSGKNLLYCDTVQAGCTDLFGCVMVKKQQHCILNKQYSKEEYETLVPRIIAHMRKTPLRFFGASEGQASLRSPSGNSAGQEWCEFFSPAVAPFAYNETTAQIYFPLSESEAAQRGFPWKDPNDEPMSVEKIIAARDIPPAIASVPDDILHWAVECEATKRPFKIIKQELEFYRKMHLPVPHVHPDDRHRRRMMLRNPRTLWSRKCAKCGKAIETTYSPERLERVYCEECYLKEVY